ncbi:2-5A-dependent ribonuclease-like isoform X2 [Channa argus]|uniref:2-5A-dependent ribonuclease-like isoform X2 n=1 Tax=Channa argus TaxID=215402 RepID=UPI00351FFCCF
MEQSLTEVPHSNPTSDNIGEEMPTVAEEYGNVSVQECQPSGNGHALTSNGKRSSFQLTIEEKSPEEEFQTFGRSEDLMSTEHLFNINGRLLISLDFSYAKIKKRLKHTTSHAVSCTRVEPKRLQLSKRWREKLDKFETSDEVTSVGTLMSIDESLYIAKGSDGTYIFLGLRYDGTEIAIKRMAKTNDNYQELKNEEVFFRYLALSESPFPQYCDAVEDDDFGYLAFKLYEYNLEEYILAKKMDFPLKKLFYQVLLALRVLHHHTPPILHGNLQMKNLWIDIKENIRLADFTKSKCLLTVQTIRPDLGPEWAMKSETFKDKNEIEDILNKELQEAGKLFFRICECVVPIHKKPLDMLLNDLIDEMIIEKPQSRSTSEKCLNHPYFWVEERKIRFLKEVGNNKQVAMYQNADLKLIASFNNYMEAGSNILQWKNEVLPLLQKIEGNKPYNESPFGLLRFIRNVHEHPFPSPSQPQGCPSL